MSLRIVPGEAILSKEPELTAKKGKDEDRCLNQFPKADPGQF